MTWQTWIGMNGLKLVKEWLNTLTWMKDVKELTWRNWNDWTWTNCHEGIEWLILKKWVKMKKSTWKNWNERRDMIEWTWIHGQKQSETDRFLQWLWYGIFATVSCTSCRPHHPRVLRPWHFLLSMWDWDLVRLLPRPSIFHDCYVLLRLTFAFY